ncbi:HNH endonuclease signature motif containing protein [Streptomyces sp. NPDC050485]|uniref:HNH endonuclease signature motif containing protein n=1 Tax=Streptomyces sp. NPDC050485 TaxID=3365617 RepID=UPI0037A344FD
MNDSCHFEGCDRPLRSRIFCEGHDRQYRHGERLRSIEVRAPYKATGRERAEWYVNRASPEGDCLTHGLHRDRGYATVRYEGRNEKAHRFVYRHLVQELGPGDVVHHKCGNRACIKPDHLQCVTAQENTAEMLERNFYRKRIEELEIEKQELEMANADLKAMVGV